MSTDPRPRRLTDFQSLDPQSRSGGGLQTVAATAGAGIVTLMEHHGHGAGRTPARARHLLHVHRRPLGEAVPQYHLKAEAQGLHVHRSQFSDLQHHPGDPLEPLRPARIFHDTPNTLGERHFMHGRRPPPGSLRSRRPGPGPKPAPAGRTGPDPGPRSDGPGPPGPTVRRGGSSTQRGSRWHSRRCARLPDAAHAATGPGRFPLAPGRSPGRGAPPPPGAADRPRKGGAVGWRSPPDPRPGRTAPQRSDTPGPAASPPGATRPGAAGAPFPRLGPARGAPGKTPGLAGPPDPPPIPP